MAVVADHIVFEGKTSSFRRLVATDVKYHMDAYHRKIEYAARIRRALANPHGSRLNLRIDRMWYARAVSKAIINSAAAELAAAKGMNRAEEILNGMFVAKGQAASGTGGGMNLDA